MKTEKFTINIDTAYGKKLETPIRNVPVSYEAFVDMAEVKEKNAFPSDAEVVKYLNAKEKASARAKATTAALEAAGIEKPTLESSAELRWKNIFNALVAGKVDEDTAREQANALVPEFQG